jgi:acyl dehydratase
MMSVQVGMEIPPLEIAAVSAEKMKTMAALLGDSNPIHFDEQAVRQLGMGDRVVNQGSTNMAYLITMLCAWAGGYDRLRDLRVRLVGRVLAQDTVRAVGTVTAVRREAGLTWAECAVRLDVVGGNTAIAGTATVVLDEAGVR